MKMSDAGIALLRKFEGCRLKAYQLPGEEYWTIGYGHYGPDVSPDMIISQAEADMMLRIDLEKYEKLVEKYVTDIPLNQNRFDALVSYTYNRGSGGIKQLSQNCHTVEEYSEGFVKYWGSAERYKAALLERRAKEKALFDTPMSDEMQELSSGNTADRVIAIAMAEEGYIEKRDGNEQFLYDKLENAGDKNYTKYGLEMHSIYPGVMDYPAPWCDCFVDWCFYKAYGVATAKKLIGGDFDDYTVASAQMYQNMKAYIYKGDGRRPQIGYQIFFHNGTRICHTGLVYAVDNQYVYTIEGNTSTDKGVIPNGGAVCKKKYKLDYVKIHGYGIPAYDKIGIINAPKQHIQLNYQPGHTYFTNVDLNIRCTPDSSNSSNKTGKVLPRKTKVVNLATTRAGDQIWMLLDPKAVGVSTDYAWICADTGVKCYVTEKSN